MAPLIKEPQRAEIEGMQARCNELLRGIPPAGPKFAAAVAAMLEREEHWIEWKRTGCAAFDKAAALTTGGGEASLKRRAPTAGRASKRMQLGNSELTRLWNMGGEPFALKPLSRLANRSSHAAAFIRHGGHVIGRMLKLWARS